MHIGCDKFTATRHPLTTENTDYLLADNGYKT